MTPDIADVELGFTALLAAPLERVFAALTHAEHLAHWLCDEAESDPRNGGKLVLRWKRPGSSAEPFTGKWVAFDSPRSCAFEGGQPDYPDGYAGRIEWALAAEAGGTRLTTTHRMPPKVEYAPVAQTYTAAWPRALDRLVEYLTPKQ